MVPPAGEMFHISSEEKIQQLADERAQNLEQTCCQMIVRLFLEHQQHVDVCGLCEMSKQLLHELP